MSTRDVVEYSIASLTGTVLGAMAIVWVLFF